MKYSFDDWAEGVPFLHPDYGCKDWARIGWDAAIKASDDSNEWISVKTKMPVVPGEYVIFSQGCGVRISRYYDNRFDHDRTNNSYPNLQAAHWMNLPSPPAGDKSNG